MPVAAVHLANVQNYPPNVIAAVLMFVVGAALAKQQAQFSNSAGTPGARPRI